MTKQTEQTSQNACPQCGSHAALIRDFCPDCRCDGLTRFVLTTQVRTEHDYKPGPVRNFDWSAVTDNYEPGDPIGYGADELAAVADLRDQMHALRNAETATNAFIAGAAS